MESSLHYQRRIIRANCHVLWPYQFPSNVPNNDELNLLGGNSRTMDDYLHGRHGNTHQTTRERDRTPTHTPPQILRLPSPHKTCHRRCSESLDCSDCCVKSSTIELKSQEVFLRPYADAWKTVSATGSRKGKQWIGRITRDSTCRLWASKEAPIYCYKGGGV